MADVIIVLAAGSSNRFGSPKQLFRWNDQPLVRYVAQEALGTGARVIVVEGAHSLRAALHGLSVELVHAESWSAGPGASIKCGAACVHDDDSVLVTLADLPSVNRTHFEMLLGTMGPLVASAYDDTIGVPAVFRAPFVAVLRTLDDARGCKPLLLANRALVSEVHIPEAAFDLDTPP